MRLISVIILLIFLGCNSSETNTNLDFSELRLEIEGLERINKKFKAKFKEYKDEVPATITKSQALFEQILDFKDKLKNEEILTNDEITAFRESFNEEQNSTYFPKQYFDLLAKSTISDQQYMYLLQIENYMYQSMMDEALGSFYRFNIVQPYVRVNNNKINIGDDVSINVGFSVINTFKPFEVKLDGEVYKFESVEDISKIINIKASQKGLNRIEGTLKYKLSNEYVEAPILVEFEVN